MTKLHGTEIKVLTVKQLHSKDINGALKDSRIDNEFVLTSDFDGLWVATVCLTSEDILKGYVIAMQTMATQLGMKFECELFYHKIIGGKLFRTV